VSDMIKKIFKGILAGIRWLIQDDFRRREDERLDIWEDLEHARGRFFFGGIIYKRLFTKRFEDKGVKKEDGIVRGEGEK